jgi:hypothetical protein
MYIYTLLCKTVSVGHSGCVSYRTLLSGLTWVDRSKDVQDHSTRAERVRVCHVFSNLKVTWIHLDTIDMSSYTPFFRVTANYKQLGQRGSLVDQSQHSVRKPMFFSFQEHFAPKLSGKEFLMSLWGWAGSLVARGPCCLLIWWHKPCIWIIEELFLAIPRYP